MQNADRGAFQFAAKGAKARPFSGWSPALFAPPPFHMTFVSTIGVVQRSNSTGDEFFLFFFFLIFLVFSSFFFFAVLLYFPPLLLVLVVLTLPTNYHDNWSADCQPHSRHILIHRCPVSSFWADLFHLFRALFFFFLVLLHHLFLIICIAVCIFRCSSASIGFIGFIIESVDWLICKLHLPFFRLIF